MLSSGFQRPEQFLPRVQALVWDLASALPSSLDGSPPAWLVAVCGLAMDRRCGTWLGVGSRQGPGTMRLAADRRIVPNSQLGRVSCSKRWTFGTKSRCVPGTADETQFGFPMVEFFTC